MLYAPGVEWTAGPPPDPTWWEHQIRVLEPERRLDPERFAARAAELARPAI